MRIDEFLRQQDVVSRQAEDLAAPMRLELLLHRIGKAKRVLDVGCGTGWVASQIAARNNEVWGVELNPEAAAKAEARGVRIKRADIEDGLPFEAGEFDFVNIGGALENVYDTRTLLEECARVLKPEGRLFITVSNLNSLANRLRVVAGGYIETAGAYPEDHRGSRIRQFNLAKLEELCRVAGLRLEDARGIPLSEPAEGESGPSFLSGPLSVPKGWVEGLIGRAAPSLHRILLVTASKIRN